MLLNTLPHAATTHTLPHAYYYTLSHMQLLTAGGKSLSVQDLVKEGLQVDIANAPKVCSKHTRTMTFENVQVDIANAPISEQESLVAFVGDTWFASFETSRQV
jgi:hypothetical protein